MSGFVLLTAPCFCCGRPFASNPASVPSYANTPICEPCVLALNDQRKALGLAPWVIPPDAYQPLPEHELGENMRRPARLQEGTP